MSEFASAEIAALAALVLAILVFAISDYRRDPLTSLPRPAFTLPIIGNTITITRHRQRMYDWVAEQCELHQRPWRMHILGRGPAIVLASPALFEDVLKTHFEQFPKDEGLCAILRDFFGYGIFTANTERWHQQRHTASTLFSFHMLKHTMLEVVQVKVEVLSATLAQYAENQQAVSLKSVLNHFTCDVFAKIGFGIEVRPLLERGPAGATDFDFVDAAVTISRVMYARFLRPMWLWRAMRYLNIAGERQLKKSIQYVDSTAYRIINASILRKHRLKRANVKETPPPARDLISMFMESNALDTTEDENPKIIRDAVVSFIAAGTDTTSQSMLSFVVMMNRYPTVLKRIRDELKLKLPSLRSCSELPSLQDLSTLVYLEATIRENLRLNPAIPVTTRAAITDVVLSDGTLVPKGTRAVLSFYAAMRSKAVWGDDALEFKPDRWIDPSTGLLKPICPFKFPAFLAGPRACLGKKLAMVELKMMLAVVLTRFDLTTEENAWDLTYQTGLTASVKGPVMARVGRYGCDAIESSRRASVVGRW